MLNQDRIQGNRELIVRFLLETKRVGIPALLQWLDGAGFFKSLASTKYHGCYPGGLAQHSLNVYGRYIELSGACGVEVPSESVALACLLHDVCKCGAYLKLETEVFEPETTGEIRYVYNEDHPGGHALLSIERIERFVSLTDLERRMIKFHMGIYGAMNKDGRRDEYTLLALKEALNDPAVKLMCFADELATLEEMAAARNIKPETGNLK